MANYFVFDRVQKLEQLAATYRTVYWMKGTQYGGWQTVTSSNLKPQVSIVKV
jgi:hypothetical protein